MSQTSEPVPSVTGGFLGFLNTQILRPILLNERNQYLNQNLPEQYVEDANSEVVVELDLELQLAKQKNKLYLLGAAGILAAILAVSVLSK